MPAVSKRVAVIGAGPSGLVTIKELVDEGHDPTCYERAAGLGGVFRFDEREGVVWESCRLTSSGLLMAFSDFPAEAGEAAHMSVGAYVQYLARYCETFDLSRRIRFGTTVESVTQEPDGGWRVRSAGRDGTRHEERYDAIAVCSGLNQSSHLPHVPGQETYTGTIVHGSQYRRAEPMRGKRVLVVGGGESAADIVDEVSRLAAETVLSLRRGVAVLPRRRRGRPTDYSICRLNHSSPHWVSQTRHPADAGKRRVYRTLFMPLVIFGRPVQVATTFLHEILPLFHPRGLMRGRAGLAEIRLALKERRLILQLRQESGGNIQEQFGTKTTGFVTAIAAGRCRRAGQIVRFKGDRVHFQDGCSFEPDVVVFCTGFEVRLPFLDDDLSQTPRYLHAVNPAVGVSLGFIGFVRPAHGAVPPLAELQARWLALLHSGKVALPSQGDMREWIDRFAGIRRHRLRAVRGRLEHLVDYTSYCDELASHVGCKPTLTAVRRESLGFRLRFFAALFASAQYRLVGPHAKPAIARQVIAGLPVTRGLPMLSRLYVRWKLSRLLHRVLGTEYAPKLDLKLE